MHAIVIMAIINNFFIAILLLVNNGLLAAKLNIFAEICKQKHVYFRSAA